MNVHLVDGTYELFRHYYALPSHVNDDGEEVAATRGVVRSLLSMVRDGATHVAVATDHVVESFRNELWPDYKDASGIEPELLAQFEPLEEALRAAGFRVWAMTEYEADDALAAGAALAGADDRVERVLICTPDKDLAQCVKGERVVQLDRRKRVVTDEDGVVEKFGVRPASIPDYLALVGDSADGFPGLPGWGAKSTATVLAHYGHIENIPSSAEDWKVAVRGAARLAATLAEERELARLFRRLATLAVEAPVGERVDELRWTGPARHFGDWCERLDAPELLELADGIGG
ncbi:MAG: flap endonuclease [Gemmatimonadetes bacterium]|uniref:Flap endonuclease n=1 Tax=Candidatus Kutchimonas denitrificans TaxID=3056748 RepID=A0AAE5CD17_9BACT|nr:flap endonuclease [Gemmatimonadota bacterium]NIR76425.1 flap endonuclease [Candidatus Kutchimonas denitrificans]NIS03244.1 flap endonuclease [Gemmatimonadota bacterium]NIT69105.1 flap endonuclease [Gemmatimonadota bacterium]NIU54497.1 flap endonuclease [Gemmatimonadota bacterium]